ncbi:MAG: ABC transporter permease [Verrucomicrobia bacterium]|nr:ABC transporter permease [Verrucomicrobiota bacterium]MCH8526992.1 ABC transporter permease [Kiritimatiellia bacterium]
MMNYTIRRILLMFPLLGAISILVFVLMDLPPGDAVSARLDMLAMEGQPVSEELVTALRARYHLDDPLFIRYLRWAGGFLRGDLGYSITMEQPVNELVRERLGYTVVISLLCVLFTWLVAFPVGFFSAIRQYSIPDHVFTFLAFLGMATPNFVLAIVLVHYSHNLFGTSVGGLYSFEYEGEPMNTAKFVDILRHIWIPVVVVGTAGTAGMVRTLRANLLDELRKPYVTTARAKGVGPIRLILKYPVRIAINPFVSTIGWLLPSLFSGDAIVGVVLGLPTIGPLLLSAVMQMDMTLAGSLLMLMSILTVFGTLLSDLLLAVVDPRIRYE